MASTAKEREKMFECEVKRRRVRTGGGYEPFWKVKAVDEALVDGDTEFRCKECGGAVKLHRKRVETGPASHAEHLHRTDSEYCVAGLHFRQAADGRVSRSSANPVS